MKKVFKRQVASVLIILFLISLGLPQNAFAKDMDLNGTIQNTIATEKAKINYGPYDNVAKDKKHTYEPFNEKEDEKSKGIKDLNYRKDRVLVKMEQPNANFGLFEAKSASLKNSNITKLEPVNKSKKGIQREQSSKLESDNGAIWYSASLKEGADVFTTIDEISKETGVVVAEPDYIRKISDMPIPNITSDEKMGEQWYLDRLGIKDAWNHLNGLGINPGGKREVVVAVIDTGVDYNHPDLAANMWTNTAETPGDGIDNDGNGYVDDVYGANMVTNESSKSGDPMDDNGHGTHVAGIIAAQANNGIGGVGIAYNVKIMAIKAGQSSGYLSSSDIIRAINYAVDKGADVINMSFGGYGASIQETDGLQQAFGNAVLVASAGNDGKPNLPHPEGRDMYPAAYPWVLGVMAEAQTPAPNGDNLAEFSNWDYKAEDTHEYEVMAPGVDILSTLPGGQYAKWDGTSMSAPVVAAIAALVRSKFSDKNTYSSRFIMGQIVSTGDLKQGITYDSKKPPLMYREVNAFKALTDTPKPNLTNEEHYLFDKKSIDDVNNEDGVIDAGETIDLAMILRNHWGKADNTVVKIDAKSPAGISDPYVTIINGSVNYGAIGNFGTDDNGLIYDNDVVVGVNNPFKIKIAENTPNDYIIALNVTMTCNNGFDISDKTSYTTTSKLTFGIRNGTKLPGVIDKDMTLTKDKYWVIPNATVIEKGAKVTVEPGTQIQFWSSEPEDPYAEKTMAYIQVKGEFIVNGTAEEPVEMFASNLFPGYEVKIYSTSSLDMYGSMGSYQGYAELNYAKIMNPNLAVNKVDHSYFSQDLFNVMFKRRLYEGKVDTYSLGPIVYSDSISNSRFYKLGNSSYIYYMLRISGKSIGNLFDSCVYYMDEQNAENNVYLKNYKDDFSYGISKGKDFGNTLNINTVLQSIFPVKYNDNGSTYIAVRANASASGYEEMKQVEDFAKKLGGHIVTINDAAENEFIRNYINNYLNYDRIRATYPNVYDGAFSGRPVIGLSDFEEEGKFKWIGGEESSYTNWQDSEPNNKIDNTNGPANIVLIDKNSGKWLDYYYAEGPYIIEVPGVCNVTGISLDANALILGAGGASAKLTPTIAPVKANNKDIKWTSSNPSIATVDDNGVVKPIAIGNAIITATTVDGGFTSSCEVTVRQIVPATGIGLNKVILNLVAGQEENLIPTVFPLESTNKNVKWDSNSKAVATVDERGTVKAISNGTAKITATTEDGGFIAECTANIITPVSGVILDSGFSRLVIGELPTTLKATVKPDNATNKNVIWSSSNERVAKVDATGAVTPVGEGTALITVTTEEGAYSSNCIVTVWNHAVSFNTLKVAAGYNHSIALNEDGTVWAWGNNDNGKLGDGTTINRSTPVPVKNISDVKAVAAGYGFSVAVKNDGTVWCWGNQYPFYYGYTPQKINDLNDVVDIASGNNHIMALKSDGTVWTWGNNDYGKLGDGTTSYRQEPVQVENLTEVASIVAGENYSLALKKDGSVWAWGYNGYGQLGDGTKNNSSVPVKVKDIANVKAISAGSSFSTALKVDGTVWQWGYIPNYGECLTPTRTQQLLDIISIASGSNHTLTVKKDGTVWAWGSNDSGQLGIGNNNGYSSPQQIPDFTGAVAIAAKSDSTLIIKSDGSIFAVGNNQNGQLGNMSITNSSVPVQTLFGILPDTEAPIVVSSSPLNGDLNVSTKGIITITFSESVKAGDNFGYIKLKDSNQNTISLKRKSISGSTLVFEPLNELKYSTSYTLQIPSDGLRDMFSNGFSSGYTLNFTTTSELIAIMNKVLSYENSVNSESILDTNSVTVNNTIATPQTDITAEQIEAARKEFINSGALSTIKNNAILNRWWDPNVDHWMRFTSNDSDGGKRYLAQNYWGTTSETLIGKAIIDFNDFRNMEEVIYKPILTQAPESAYPFVTDIYVSTDSEERATKVGAEKVKVNVLFNRDMNTNVQPQVSFGPAFPITDYTVHPVDGGWIDGRHWIGEFNINPVTGDGYQLFRVAGAQAANDPWLVTGNDSERFRFEIITSGTESMNLQASGEGGSILLSWSQDDFNTLAGYNIYRAERKDATEAEFVKINTSIIPADIKEYSDKSVEPGKTYYYKFKVVKTDGTESDFSNIASAAATDTVPPVIKHEVVTKAAAGLPLQIFASITDNVQVQNVKLYYRKTGTTDYRSKDMVKTADNRYSTAIEGDLVIAPGVEYYIEATDGVSKASNGTAAIPNKVIVTDGPKITAMSPVEGPDSGGTKVIISGSNFKVGAMVSFDGKTADNVVVESENRITAVTPVHIAATVDVKVKSPNGYEDILYRGFSYKKTGVDVSILNAEASKGTIFEVPVNISNVSGLTSAQLKVSYDKDLLVAKGARLGNIVTNFLLSKNTTVPGEVTIAMSGAKPLAGSGSLVYLQFDVLNSTKTSGILSLVEATLNAGNIVTNKGNGTFTVSANHSINGYIRYYGNNIGVSGVNLGLGGVKNYLGTSAQYGSYTVSDVINGDYTLKPSKNDGIDGITGYDASLVLQYAAGLTTLSDYQKIAADVNCDGKIDAVDASLILQNLSGDIQLPFPGAEKVWVFRNPEYKYIGLNSNLYYQDFTAILLGDVSGNWGNVETPIQSNSKAEFNIGALTKEMDGKTAIPVMVNMVNGKLFSSDLIVSYDKDVASIASIDKSELSTNFGVTVNSDTPGEIRVSMAGAVPVATNGKLLNIKFNSEDDKKLLASTSINRAEVNEKAVTSVLYLSCDVNKDMSIDMLDVAAVTKNYNKRNIDAGWNDSFDINRDGVIDIFDLVLITKQIR